jgi:hypothetical protein
MAVSNGRARFWNRASIPLLAAGMLVACAETETPTSPQPPLHRTVGLVVRDSLGAPITGASVVLVADLDSAGIARVVRATTNTLGLVSVVLGEGSWGAHALRAGGIPRAAGATFFVPGDTRPAADTLMVNLTIHTASAARGVVTLTGRGDHSGTVVACPPAEPPAVTDSTGAFSLGLLPLGRWTLTMYHPGFAFRVAPVTIPAPGDTVAVPAAALAPLSQTVRLSAPHEPARAAPYRP